MRNSRLKNVIGPQKLWLLDGCSMTTIRHRPCRSLGAGKQFTGSRFQVFSQCRPNLARSSSSSSTGLNAYHKTVMDEISSEETNCELENHTPPRAGGRFPHNTISGDFPRSSPNDLLD